MSKPYRYSTNSSEMISPTSTKCHICPFRDCNTKCFILQSCSLTREMVRWKYWNHGPLLFTSTNQVPIYWTPHAFSATWEDDKCLRNLPKSALKFIRWYCSHLIQWSLTSVCCKFAVIFT